MPGVDKNACSSHRRKRRALVNVGRDRKSRGPAELHASFSAFEQLWRAHACIFHEQTDFNPRGMRSNYPPSPALGLAFVKNQPSSEPELPRPLSPPLSRPPLRKDSAGRRARGGRIINELPPGQLPSSTFSAFSPLLLRLRVSIRSIFFERGKNREEDEGKELCAWEIGRRKNRVFFISGASRVVINRIGGCPIINRDACFFSSLFFVLEQERREEWRRKKRWGLDGWRVCYTIINGEDVNLVGEGFSIAREFFDRYL